MPVTTPSGPFHIIVDMTDAAGRLDTVVAARISALTRSQAAALIQNGTITVNGRSKKPSYRVCSGDDIRGVIPLPIPGVLVPEPIDLDILYEDDEVILVNKPPGMVVHPAPGHASGTLVNALLHHCPAMGPIGGEMRPGIVHRIDKGTSGILVVAKNGAAHAHLSAQFAARSIRKQYLAIVYGDVDDESGSIDLAIGRHPVERKKMAVTSRKPRKAVTQWRLRERFNGLTMLELKLKTGRTHQARVHCAAIGHPIVGDPVYAGRRAGRHLPGEVYALTRKVDRQMLHARRLTFIHPSGSPISITAALPEDMALLITQLRRITP